jgi:hypothetical protein
VALRKIDLDRWEHYFRFRDEGHSVEKAARGSRIDAKTAWRFERGEAGSTGIEAAQLLGITHVGGLEVAPDISKEAKRALDDFAYFRRRYFGRVSTPWQERAAYVVLDKLATRDREFGVINSPPGGGKSTLFTHDIPAWLTARDRAIRIQIGSGTERQARMYVGRLKKTLEREAPMVPDTDAKDKGVAFDAVATLAGDYGAFKPEGRTDLWRAEALVVRQLGGMALDDKEPTMSAWGQDSKFLGGRFDFIIWDDLVDRKNTLTKEAGQTLLDMWLTEFETRLEPGGLLLLQGQRIATDDLYRFCLDLTDLAGAPKYFHVRYQAHAEDRCTGDHDEKAQPYPTGCLLDPYRLPWKLLSNIASATPRVYDIQYQQNDGQATAILVEQAWLDGGKDTAGVQRPGCYDHERYFGRSALEPFQGWSVVSVDPSPAEFWGITWWVMAPAFHKYEICGLWRKRLGSEEFLSVDMETLEYSGLLEDIRVMADEARHPLQAAIIEVNAAQKFLLAQPHMQSWARAYDVSLMAHTTHINKADPEFGVTGIADFFRQGAIRLPFGNPEARLAVRPLTHELVTWPNGLTDDLVMSVWFAIRAVQMTYVDPNTPAPRFSRPSWLGKGRALADVYGGTDVA